MSNRGSRGGRGGFSGRGGRASFKGGWLLVDRFIFINVSNYTFYFQTCV